ncbi:MAG: T9SS type A sorting domain-containing protein, partial [Saprospiraceae bacterium]
VIEFKVPESNSRVVIELCNLMGSKIATLFDGTTEKGSTYKAEIAGDNLAAGTYIYRIVYDNQIVSRKIVLIK